MARVKRLILAIFCLFNTIAVAQKADQQQPSIDVNGPTVIAFCVPVTEAELEKNPDTNEALADFQLYASQAREPLRKAGIEYRIVYARSFKLRAGKRVTTFCIGKAGVGHYLVEPGKTPRIEYGVMADVGLVQLAKEYFSIHVEVATPQD